MSEDTVTVLEARRRRPPAVRESIVEQIIGAGVMRPDGDRRHGAESGRIEAEENGAKRQDDVMREFILGDDLVNARARRLVSTPCHQVRERGAFRELVLHALHDERLGGISSAHTNVSHGGIVREPVPAGVSLDV